MTTYQPLNWTVSQWLNVQDGFDVRQFEGRVILAAAFQMLCPGCVEQTIPQLKRAAAMFSASDVAVAALHTVFEHHDAMRPEALRAFLHEYKVGFPVAIDAPRADGHPVPATMSRYEMQGTPTVLLYDQDGRLRRQVFGHLPDMQLGAEVAALRAEPRSHQGDADETAIRQNVASGLDPHSCGPVGCHVPASGSGEGALRS